MRVVWCESARDRTISNASNFGGTNTLRTSSAACSSSLDTSYSKAPNNNFPVKKIQLLLTNIDKMLK